MNAEEKIHELETRLNTAKNELDRRLALVEGSTRDWSSLRPKLVDEFESLSEGMEKVVPQLHEVVKNQDILAEKVLEFMNEVNKISEDMDKVSKLVAGLKNASGDIMKRAAILNSFGG